MKLIINKNQIGGVSAEQFLRRAGYAYIRDRRRGTESFARRLGSYHYPRLHMYVDDNGNKAVFNLHLDQKQASYRGSHMHSAEYDGPVVEREIERLKSLLSGPTAADAVFAGSVEDPLDAIRKNNNPRFNLPRREEKPRKRSWWRLW